MVPIILPAITWTYFRHAVTGAVTLRVMNIDGNTLHLDHQSRIHFVQEWHDKPG